MNHLYYGDNLRVLREHVKDESVDLVYLDPPFNSNQDYNVLFAEKSGTRAAAQIKAFEDTWTWDENAQLAFEEIVEAGGRVSEAMQSFRTFLGTSDMMAYLAMMAPRLVELRRVMKPTASIYLHCDPTASHYLKMLMDAVFGPAHFRSEITWQRTNVHNDAKRWSPVADVLLYYGKSSVVTWNPIRLPHTEEHLASKYRHREGERRFTLSDMSSPSPRPNMIYEWRGFAPPPLGWRYSRETMAHLEEERRIWYPTKHDGTFDTAKRPRLKRFLDEMAGTVVGNVWTDIAPINSQAQERLGYPTQKPVALLERVIKASSVGGQTVLDPFCGCGTAIDAAQKLGRQWIGIDITHLAIGLIKRRLRDAYGPAIDGTYSIEGEPVSFEDAVALAALDKYQFQWWALSLVGAAPTEKKKGADKGIDGRLYFHDEKGGKTKQIVISVKGGEKLKATEVRDLRGVVDREHAEIGVLVSLDEPTKPMRAEAATAGHYLSPWSKTKHPRLQLITVKELMEGRGIDYPAPTQTNRTLKVAPKAKGVAKGNADLFADGDDG